MCFNYRMGFEPEPSNNLGDEFPIILTFDPIGLGRVTTLRGRLGAPSYRLELAGARAKPHRPGKLSPRE